MLERELDCLAGLTGLSVLAGLAGVANLRLRPLMSLRVVVFFSLSETVSETSDSVRDQRLWHEARGRFSVTTDDVTSVSSSASASAPASVE